MKLPSLNRILASALAASCVLFWSCATAPRQAISESSSRVSIVNADILKTAFLGAYWNQNPYLEPSGLIRGKPSEFVVYKVEIELTKDAKVGAIAGVSLPDGTVLATRKSLEEMTEFWKDWTTERTNDNDRSFTLKQTYFPDSQDRLKAGRYSFYLVVMSKSPIARPAKAWAEISIEGQSNAVYEFELPEVVKK